MDTEIIDGKTASLQRYNIALTYTTMHYTCCLVYNSLFDRNMPYDELKGYYLYIRDAKLKELQDAKRATNKNSI